MPDSHTPDWRRGDPRRFYDPPDSVQAIAAGNAIITGMPGTVSYHVTAQAETGETTVDMNATSGHTISASTHVGGVTVGTP